MFYETPPAVSFNWNADFYDDYDEYDLSAKILTIIKICVPKKHCKCLIYNPIQKLKNPASLFHYVLLIAVQVYQHTIFYH